MIQINNAILEFEKFTSNYDLNDPRIKRKHDHSLSVMTKSKNIARSLNLTDEEVNLASLIGLIHDVGRFEQQKRYNTFRDKDSVNHATLGNEMLFTDGLIRKFISNDCYDHIIKKAIKCHNQINIDPGLDDKTLLFARIIRDADRLDNISIMAVSPKNPPDYSLTCSLNPRILDDMIDHKLISRAELETEVDHAMSAVAFVHDIYFPYTLNSVKEKGYLEQLIKIAKCGNPVTDAKLDYILDHINKYIDARIDNNINLTLAKEAFEDYISNFDQDNYLIKLKYDHTLRIMDFAKQIADSLNLNREDKDLAQIIALLHDIGRFEQIKKYAQMDDRVTEDHAKLSIKTLFDENLIDKFLSANKNYDHIIKPAILNHNKIRIDDSLDEQTLLHAKLIRDADKLDIFKILSTQLKEIDKDLPEAKNCIISNNILDKAVKGELISIYERESITDYAVNVIAFIYDLNYKKSFEIIKETRWIDQIIENSKCGNQETDEKLEYIHYKATQYVNERVGEKND